LWSWGCNPAGQLGQNDVIQRSSPVQIPGTTWTDIANDYYSMMASQYR
jgi:alpha-tubulin suppressor-like RCC1 family protein